MAIPIEEFRKLSAAGSFNKKGRLVITERQMAGLASLGEAVQEAKPAKANKYGAKPVKDPDGGRIFPSTFEFNTATDLRNMVKAGLILSVGRQVLVLLPGGVTWQIDFVLHHLDGSVEYVEAKGKDTADFKIKEALFREKYPHIKLSIQRSRQRKKGARV